MACWSTPGGDHARAWCKVFATLHLKFNNADRQPYVGFDDDHLLAKESIRREQNLTETLIAIKRQSFAALQDRGITPLVSGVALVRGLVAMRRTSAIKLALASALSRKEIMRNMTSGAQRGHDRKRRAQRLDAQPLFFPGGRDRL